MRFGTHLQTFGKLKQIFLALLVSSFVCATVAVSPFGLTQKFQIIFFKHRHSKPFSLKDHEFIKLSWAYGPHKMSASHTEMI